MSVAGTVREYLDANPTVQEALALGIVNLSALARRIEEDTGLDAYVAIQAACRRTKPRQAVDESRLQALLATAQMDVRTRMAVLTARRSWSIGRRLEDALRGIRDQGGTAHVVHGSEAVTIIVDEAHVDVLRQEMDAEEVQGVRRGLAQINVRTPGDVEEVPGVLVRVAAVLAARQINSVEVLSCHKDNLFLVSEADLGAAMESLRPLLSAPA